MGLSIGYSLALADATADTARERIAELHRRSSQLGLTELGQLTELQGEAIATLEPDDPLFSLKVGSLTLEDYHAIHTKGVDSIPSCRHLIGFTIFPGEGSHRCSFGLAIHAEESRQWVWDDYCKMQYASSPECGGMAHFVRCHQLVIAMVDLCQDLGILAHASDPSPYRDSRQINELVASVQAHDLFTAAAVGMMKDAIDPLGYTAQAPILERADFEGLEAEGRAAMAPEHHPD